MEKSQIVKEIKKYFKAQEFVDSKTYSKWGESSWNFLDSRLIETVLVLRRDILKVPLVCNDWVFGGKSCQRGLRTNLSDLVRVKTEENKLYLTQHIFGKAVDLVSSKMTADQMRKLILSNQSKLPCKIRMESGASAPTWLHIDVLEMVEQKEKVYVFNE